MRVRSKMLRRRVGERVNVILKTGASLEGFLDEVGRDEVLLRTADFSPAQGSDQPLKLTGEVAIHRDNIEFVQLGVR